MISLPINIISKCFSLDFTELSSCLSASDITVMECLSRTFEVKTVPLQVPYLGPDVSIFFFVIKGYEINHIRTVGMKSNEE